MATGNYHFFTDANQQASQPANYLNVQAPAQAYGPVTPGNGTADEYRVTSLHTATFNPTAYAICDGVVCVQRIPSTSLVNIILKPLVQPALNFAPVQYILYKGILASSLINGVETAPATNNDLTKAIWEDQARDNRATGQMINPPDAVLGVSRTATADPRFADDQPIDNLFYNWGLLGTLQYQLPLVRGGWSIGLFDSTSFGLEVLTEGPGFAHTLAEARKLENRISVPVLAAGATPKESFEHWHEKERVLGYMDPCAFYGSFFRTGVLAKTSGASSFVRKAGNALYHDVLFAFANRGQAYLDIRNEHAYSYNYFTNYGDFIRITHDPDVTPPANVDYYDAWPILQLSAADFPLAITTKARIPFRIQLPVGDNPQPLLYVSQGYRDINSTRNGFPAELPGSDRFYDAFDLPEGGFTVTRNRRRASMTFVVPNVTGQTATTPVSCYIRLKYLKQKQHPTTTPTVIQSSHWLDNLFYPSDLQIQLSGFGNIKSFVSEEEVYFNTQDVAGREFNGMAKTGIARDSKNTSFFLMPTSIRKNNRQASMLVALSGEASGYPDSFPTFVALKYPFTRVQASAPVLSTAGAVPIAAFVTDADADQRERFRVPDFTKFFVIVVANATYDSWKSSIAATGAPLDGRFRVYLGLKELPRDTDAAGVEYKVFELVLRGFTYDSSVGHYQVQEMSSDPSGTSNIRIYTHASP